MTIAQNLYRWLGGPAPLPNPCAFPPPHSAMLAINSDVEWTGWPEQLVLMDEFAKRGLETAFSYWLYSSPKATWRIFEDDGEQTRYAEAALALARAGLLDTNHSIGGRRHLGGCQYDRASIARAYRVLNEAGVRSAVYSNHGSRDDRQNVAGGWGDYQEGDVPGSGLYHLDLTIAAGARYFWCDPDYVQKQTALAPELDTEGGLFVSGIGRDANRYLRFRRYFGELPAGGPSLCNLAPQLGQILDAHASGYTVVYQHLGVERHPDGKPASASLPPLRADVADVLDRLKAAQADGWLLVTTTARLLDHAALMTARPWRMERKGSHLTVVFDGSLNLAGVRWPLDWSKLEGWAVPSGGMTSVSARLGREERPLQQQSYDGQNYFGLPWSRIDMAAALSDAARVNSQTERQGTIS
jgi:hypothetical protein